MGIKRSFSPTPQACCGPERRLNFVDISIVREISERNMQMVHTWKRNRRDEVVNMYKTPVMT